jgi:hypothetical protein
MTAPSPSWCVILQTLRRDGLLRDSGQQGTRGRAGLEYMDSERLLRSRDRGAGRANIRLTAGSALLLLGLGVGGSNCRRIFPDTFGPAKDWMSRVSDPSCKGVTVGFYLQLYGPSGPVARGSLSSASPCPSSRHHGRDPRESGRGKKSFVPDERPSPETCTAKFFAPPCRSEEGALRG